MTRIPSGRTLTSLVFAQKKTAADIEAWDQSWQGAKKEVESHIKTAGAALRNDFAKTHSATAVAERFLTSIAPVVAEQDWVIKGGKSPSLLRMTRDWASRDGVEAAAYYREVMRTSGFYDLCRSYMFAQVAAELDREFPVFLVEEIGYKLSKRREKARANQLCLFKGKTTGALITNLHLAEEEYDVLLDQASPQTVLDSIRNLVVWM